MVCDRPAGPHRLCSGYDPAQESYVDWANPLWEDDKATSQGEAENVIQQMAFRFRDRTH